MSRKVKITKAGIVAYHEQGYLILRGAFTKKRVKSLVDAVNRLIDRALAGEVAINWINREQRLPARISNLLHPDKFDPAYGAWLDEDLASQIETLCGGPARHSLFGMLAGGGGQPYLQGWHRDIGKPGAPDEVAFLHHHHGRFVQFNASLMPGDRFLNIVPASHLRASTPEEIEASAAKEKAQMPGAMVVEMEPGDIAYYNANLWHRGWNPEGRLRWTMHSAFWKVEYAVMKHEHGQREAMLTPGHLDRMPPVTRQFIQRYLDAYPAGEPKSLLEL
ncbi:MAG: phytanoyl-CoA dioxygenase family protein [Planctomycetes bacterium]|nr:phytanoyl-CoA dioxygenase family protein [Planctomycetota bacterium]